MDFIDDIFSIVWDISDWFWSAYLEVDSWIYPFYYLAPILLEISDAFWDMLDPIADLSDWAYDIQEAIGSILDLGDIWDAFRDWFIAASDAWEWVLDAFETVTGWIDNWWSDTSLIVQGWIDTAKEALQTLIDDLTTWLTDLQAAWDAFKTKIPSIDAVIALSLIHI